MMLVNKSNSSFQHTCVQFREVSPSLSHKVLALCITGIAAICLAVFVLIAFAALGYFPFVISFFNAYTIGAAISIPICTNVCMLGVLLSIYCVTRLLSSQIELVGLEQSANSPA